MPDTTLNGPEGHSAAQAESVLPRELYTAGAQHVKARDYPSARACLEKYLVHNPDDPAALHLLARVLYHQNRDFDKAESYLNRAITLDPDSLTAYLETLGILLIHQGKYARAREVFEYAVIQDNRQNERHTEALKFYSDLARKKGGEQPRPMEGDGEHKFIFTAEYGHKRMKAPLYVLPSIIVHVLLLLLVSYLSTHQLPFKKESIDFTYVEVPQAPSETPPPEEAQPVGEETQEAQPVEQAPAPSAAPAPKAETGPELPTTPAKVSPPVQPKVAEAQRENIPAPAAPKIKEGGASGAPGEISSKGGSDVLAIKEGEIAAVNVQPGKKQFQIKDVKPEFSGGEAKFAKKNLSASSGGAEAAGGKKFQTAKLRDKGPEMAGGPAESAGTPGGGPKWERERLAKLEEQDIKNSAASRSASEKSMGISKPSLRPVPLDEGVNNFPSKPLGINTARSAQGSKTNQGPGVRSLTDMRNEIPAYDKMQGNLGAPMPSSGGQEGAASKARANLGHAGVKDQPKSLPGSDRMGAAMNKFGDRFSGSKFASVEPMPGKRGVLQAPGRTGTYSGSGTRTPEAARLGDKASAAPGGYAGAGSASPGAGAGAGAGGGRYAGIGKGSGGNKLESAGSEGGLSGLLESASKKITGALGIGKPAGISGPSSGEFKRGGVAGSARGGSGGGGGTGGGYGGGGTGRGTRFGSTQKQSSWIAKSTVSGAGSGEQPGGIIGGKRFAEGSLGVPGADKYASAGRSGVAPKSAERQSALSRGTLLAKNTIGPRVHIVSPTSGSTNMISQTVTGNVSDTRIKKATLMVNSESRVVSVENGVFEASISLSKGRNVITVMAFDAEGNVGKDNVELDYSEPSEGAPINIMSPRNGQVFDVSEKSVITVKGTVGDPEIRRAKLIFNGNPMDIVVNRGYFEQKVALVQEHNSIMVEAVNSARQITHSQTITVGTLNIKPKEIMLILSWDKPHADFDLHVYSPSGGHTYYKSPNTYESRDAIPGGQLEQDAKGNFGPEVFTQDRAERGIYTVKSNYYYSGGDGNANAKLTVILYGDNPSRKIVRVFGPHPQADTKDGSDVWEITRFKMPEGIFLEE